MSQGVSPELSEKNLLDLLFPLCVKEMLIFGRKIAVASVRWQPSLGYPSEMPQVTLVRRVGRASESSNTRQIVSES